MGGRGVAARTYLGEIKFRVRLRSAFLSVAIVVGLVATSLPASAQVPTRQLTITGPNEVAVAVQFTIQGRLTLGNGIGLPLRTVEIRRGTETLATTQTAADGAYAAQLSLSTPGVHQLRAVSDRGSLLETQSPFKRVEAMAVIIAPDDATTTPTDLYSATQFLYTGNSAAQTGVAAGTIKRKRVAVLRGAIMRPSGSDLGGVQVTVPGHQEFGQVLAAGDGQFDMAVNGGQDLIVRYQKDGFLPVEREIDTTWRDYGVLDDVVLTPLDQAATTIAMGNASMQVARGSSVSDGDGSRRATVMFPAGTQATMTLPGGTQQTLASISVRATEFTVGPNGAAALPGALPPASGYTYAVELSADEAMAADASQVTFNQAVPFYVENFLDIPVGQDVPAGYYDRIKHGWIGSEDGRVVEIISETSGKANLDLDGDGTPDGPPALAAMGITDAERERLASLYAPGDSLWRLAMTHFTPWDLNWPFGLPAGARAPGQEEAEADSNDSCTQQGSIIGCESQTLGEVIPLAGTPYHLRYDSSRALGRAATRSLRIPLTGSSLPTGLEEISLEVTVAGRTFSNTFVPSPNLSHLFTWDGRDPYGRLIQGRETATIQIGYAYGGVYWEAGGTTDGASWGQSGSNPLLNRTRRQITLYQRYSKMLGGFFDLEGSSLGGWSLSPHHVYDSDSRSLFRGDGTTVSADVFLPALRVFAGNGSAGSGGGTFSGDGSAAHLAGLARPRGLAVGSDGSVYIADWLNARVRRVDPSGVITTFAGGGTPPSGNGDGGPATSAELGSPTNVVVASDGSVLISDPGDARIRRVAADGTISTFAGGGNPSDGLGDGLLATQAKLDSPHGISIGTNGTVYVADTGHDRVRAIAPDGAITTLAGGGSASPDHGDGEMGPDAVLANPLDVLAMPDGSVLVADSDHDRIRRVDASGEMSTFAGTGEAGAGGNGGPATSAMIGFPTALALDPVEGRVIVAQTVGDLVRAIDSEGMITTLAGTGTAGYSGDQGPPAAARLRSPEGLAVGPDHKIFVADTNNFRVRVIDSAMPGFATTDIIMPSSDGQELYHFDQNGRHLRTLDALTGVALVTFAYDTEGRLLSATDQHGNATTIDRDGNGDPTAVVSPDGQRSELSFNGNGYLIGVENAAHETVSMTYLTGGMLETFSTPSGTSTFTYDSSGRLTLDEGPGGTATTLVPTILRRGVSVAATTAEGKTTTYETRSLDSGSRRRVITSPSGATTTSVINPDGTVMLTAPDGTVTTTTMGPEPRWGMQTPMLTKITVTTPAGKTATATMARAVTLSDVSDPLTLMTQIDTVTSNSKTFTKAYDRAAKTISTTTAEGRVATTTLNAKGQVASVQAPGVATVNFSYDPRGRLTGTSQGSGATARTTTVTYDGDGFVASVADSLHTTTFDNDAVGRVTSSLLPDTNSIGFDYDDSGNLTSLTPPGRTAHGFDHTAGNQLQSYTPPTVGGQGHPTGYVFNDDRQPTAINLPGPRSIGFGYDASGRLDTTTFSRGVVDYGYNSASQVASISTPDGPTLGYGYDGSLLTSVAYSAGMTGTTAYGYDSDLRVSSRTVNGGAATGFTYDKDGLVKTAGAQNLTWDATTGMLSSTSLGNAATSYGYNAFGELETSSASYSGSGLYSASYVRDKLGQISQMTESLGGVTSVYVYTYDARGRLTDITKDGSAVEHYVYDANGNRSSATVNGTTVSGAYDARDRMESYGNATYTYLASGELATKTVPGTGITTYDYDELGSLTHVELPNGDDVNYNVDGVGRRVTRKFNGTVTNRYQYGTGLQPVAELDASGNTVSTFVYGSRGNVPDYMIKGGVNYRLVTDHVGSVRMVVNSSTGAVAQRIDYDSFGNVLSDTNPGFQPFAFAGGLYDAATALTRFGARDYDAQTGRWTAKDPILFRGGSPNLYVYVGSDPVNFGDADGLLSVRDVFGGAGQAFSNVIKGLTNAISSLMTNASCLVQGLRDYVVEIYSPFLSGEGWSQAQQMIEESAVWRGTVDTAQCAGGNLEVVIGTVNGALSLVELAGARLLNPFQNAAAHGLTAAGIEDDQQTIREGMRVIGRECFHRDWL